MDAQFDVLNNLIAQNKASSSEMRKRMSGEFATQAYKDQMINAEQQIQNAPGELEAAQKAFSHRASMNRLASKGEWQKELEN